MTVLIKNELVWLEDHAPQCDPDGNHLCSKTGKAIIGREIGRSIHDHRFSGAGGGEVRLVMHMWCPTCAPDYQPPEHGTPINDNELSDFSGPTLLQKLTRRIFQGAHGT